MAAPIQLPIIGVPLVNSAFQQWSDEQWAALAPALKCLPSYFPTLLKHLPNHS